MAQPQEEAEPRDFCSEVDVEPKRQRTQRDSEQYGTTCNCENQCGSGP